MIGYDLDGVLARTDEIFKGWFMLHHNWDVVPTDDYKFVFDYATPEDKTGKWIADEIGNALTYWGDKVMPYHQNVMALGKLFTDYGPTRGIKIITARSPKTERETDIWLRRWLPVPYELNVIGFSTGKLEHMINHGIDCYVDDRYKTVQELAPALKYVFLLNQDWNMGRKTHKSVIRINDLTEMHEVLQGVGYEA